MSWHKQNDWTNSIAELCSFYVCNNVNTKPKPKNSKKKNSEWRFEYNIFNRQPLDCKSIVLHTHNVYVIDKIENNWDTNLLFCWMYNWGKQIFFVFEFSECSAFLQGKSNCAVAQRRMRNFQCWTAVFEKYSFIKSSHSEFGWKILWMKIYGITQSLRLHQKFLLWWITLKGNKILATWNRQSGFMNGLPYLKWNWPLLLRITFAYTVNELTKVNSLHWNNFGRPLL